MTVSREKALADWKRQLLRGHNPDPGPSPEVETRKYKDNKKNDWLIDAVKRLGGRKRVSELVGRNPTYIYNVMRGYYPMSSELENLINKALEHDR
jgi:hypothetical protein